MTQTQQENKVHLRPLGNRILLRRLEQQEQLKGGIILPDTAKKRQETAEVVACGPGKKNKSGELIPISLKVGEVVMLDKYSGQEVKLDDIEYVIVREEDIIAIVQK